MTELTVRRLLIDLESPFPARWNGGDAFRSALFNALSMSFPAGEQFFIDSLRAGLQRLPEAERERMAREVQGFVGQEATHRRVHALFNENLARLGYDNEIERRALARREAHRDDDLRNQVAATAATEHFTALFSDWLLRHPEVLEGAEPRLRLLWQWHCAEESEHRSTAYDLYHAMGGKHVWRIRVFKYITYTFLGDVLRQTVRNLRHDGSLWRWNTWRSAAHTLFARDGMIRGNFAAWRAYFSPDFHPSHQDARRSQEWLQSHTAHYRVVGQQAHLMPSLAAGIALAVAALYAGFLLWYGGRGRPLAPAEIEAGLRELAERNLHPEGQALLQDLRDLLTGDDGREFIMQNLVRHRQRALYPPGHAYDDDPRAADRRYGRAILWPLLRRACALLFVARRVGRFIDPADATGWHYVAMVRYRSRRDFLHFALEIERGDIVMHKWAAIETTHVFPVRPMISLVMVRSAVLVLLVLAGLLAWTALH